MKLNIKGKVAVLGDTHFGKKQGSIKVLENILDHYEKELFPVLIDQGVEHVIQVGDIFDVRTSICARLIHIVKERFFDWFKEHDIHLIITLGNHDIFLRESRVYNSPSLVASSHVHVIKDRTYMKINGNKVLLQPWLVQGEELTREDLNGVDYVFGHLEIQGFYMVKGVEADGGNPPGLYEKCKHVFAGHFHLKQTNGNISYLGSAVQNDWSDYNEVKGFVILNEDDTIDFFENTVSRKYIILEYTNDGLYVKGLNTFPFKIDNFSNYLPAFKKHYLKFIIKYRSEENNADDYLFELKKENINFRLIDESRINEIATIDNIDVDSNKDTREIIVDAINDQPEEVKNKFMNILSKIDA